MFLFNIKNLKVYFIRQIILVLEIRTGIEQKHNVMCMYYVFSSL